MPFITQGKANLKYILIVVILAAIVGGGILGYLSFIQKETIPPTKFPTIKKTEKMISEKIIEIEIPNGNIYKNEEYGFGINTPEEDILEHQLKVRIFPFGSEEDIIKGCLDFTGLLWGDDEIKQVTISDIRYTVFISWEGAAGSRYISYCYVTRNSEKERYYVLGAIIQETNCMNFGEEGSKEYIYCEESNKKKEKLIEQMVSTFKFVD